MNATPNTESNEFDEAVTRAYRETMAKFREWADDPLYRKYVVPQSTDPEPGFAIFYTELRFQPDLLIVGQNPSNFAGKNAGLIEPPNAEMLSGIPPTKNSYTEHGHLFGNALQTAFENNPALLESAVGMNVWSFQCVLEANAAPLQLRSFCKATSRTLVTKMKPRTILCLGREAFNALHEARATSVKGTRKGEYSTFKSSPVWFVYHPTGSYSSEIAEHDLPIVIREIEAVLGAPPRAGHERSDGPP